MPLACEASAVPYELRPHRVICSCTNYQGNICSHPRRHVNAQKKKRARMMSVQRALPPLFCLYRPAGHMRAGCVGGTPEAQGTNESCRARDQRRCRSRHRGQPRGARSPAQPSAPYSLHSHKTLHTHKTSRLERVINQGLFFPVCPY